MQADHRFKFWNRCLVIAIIAFLVSLLASPYLAHHPFHNHTHIGRYLIVLSTLLVLYAMASTRIAWKELQNLFEED